MPDVVNLTCPSCGGRLQVPNELERFACGYCGNELRVQRGGGIVTLQPVMESLGRIEGSLSRVEQNVQRMGAGADTTASELALQRIDKQMLAIQAQAAALPRRNPVGAVILTVLGGMGVLAAFSSGIDGGTLFALVMLIVGVGLWTSRRARVRKQTLALQSQLVTLLEQQERHQRVVRQS